MKKTSVYLEEADARRLEWLAEREGKSQAEVLREAIRVYQPERARPDRAFAMQGAGEGDGRAFADLTDDEVAELMKGFGE